MRFIKILDQKNFQLFTYKLAHDVLFLILLTFIGMLVAEGMIPGFLSAHLSFLKLTIILFVTMTAIEYLGGLLRIAHETAPMHKNKIIPLFLVFTFLLIGNSMLKFPFWQNILITLLTLFVFFLFYQLIFFPKKEDE